FTSVIAGILVALFGGSRVHIGGPVGAFVSLLAPVVTRHGPQALVFFALMDGLILIITAASKFGKIPAPKIARSLADPTRRKFIVPSLRRTMTGLFAGK
ncbi:MAG: hypothetical protein ACREFR_00865, partial [Limisphaerales bacterium]